MMRKEWNILLLDDEPASLAYSLDALRHFAPEERIHTAATVEEAMEILGTQHIELAFLDVELTHSDGFALCSFIHRQYPEIQVVILTGHVDLGAKSYDYEPFDFLTKPVDILRMERTFTRLEKLQKTSRAQRFAIETKTGVVIVKADDVRYIEKSGSMCKIHLADQTVQTVSLTLDKLEKILAGSCFFRTHQSYLVPLDRVSEVGGSRLGSFYEAKLDDGTVVPVSRSRYTKLKEHIMLRSMKLM